MGGWRRERQHWLPNCIPLFLFVKGVLYVNCTGCAYLCLGGAESEQTPPRHPRELRRRGNICQATESLIETAYKISPASLRPMKTATNHRQRWLVAGRNQSKDCLFFHQVYHLAEKIFSSAQGAIRAGCGRCQTPSFFNRTGSVAAAKCNDARKSFASCP